MRTKLFLAFATVILISLLSNMAFRNLTFHDFEHFISGEREEGIYLVLAALEGRAESGPWEPDVLRNAARWALLLGYEVRIFNEKGTELMNTDAFLKNAGPMEKRRLTGLGVIPIRKEGMFQAYPLYLKSESIGTLAVRDTRAERGSYLRADLFRKRSHAFLLMSVVGMGVAALILGFIFIHYLSRPIRGLTTAVKRVQEGDLTVRTTLMPGRDEISSLSRAFNDMVETLERQELRQKHLVTDLAHELRTPVSILVATVEAIEDGITPPDGKALSSLKEEAHRIRRLIVGIESMAREESGYFFLERRQVDLHALMADTAEGIRPLLERKGLALVIDPPPEGGVPAYVDPDKMEQVVRNLLSNAIRHTSHGTVGVSAFREPQWCGIRVTDRGPGIDPEMRHTIFERFFKDEKSPGLGIGLTIVRNVVEAHDGIVEVFEHEGGGSVFEVRLPAP